MAVLRAEVYGVLRIFSMRGLHIFQQPHEAAPINITDTAAKRQGRVCCFAQDPCPATIQITKLPLSSCRADSLSDDRHFCDGYNLIIS